MPVEFIASLLLGHLLSLDDYHVVLERLQVNGWPRMRLKVCDFAMVCLRLPRRYCVFPINGRV